uniref:Uncharacterized protein n=1 Tax=viral metagenome TaxID=1070528 RepID=A0A6C0D6L3_9ZZZZ
MKVLIVFRGENKRFSGERFHDVRMCIPNNKVRLIDSLRNKGYTVDTMLVTYPSEYLNHFVESYNPKKVFLMDYENSSQHLNFKYLLESIEPYVSEYDRILVFRFDFLFKKNIEDWNEWQKEGIMFPWKDVSEEIYNQRKYTMDGFFCLDSKWFSEFKQMYDSTYTGWLGVTNGLHFLTTELEKTNIPFYFMEKDCYESNTSLAGAGHNNPYCINSLYVYYHDDYHLTYV